MNRNRLSRIVPAAAGLAAALAFAPPSASGAVRPGQAAPNFSKTALGGGTISLSDYSGEVVVLFLFGYS